MKFDIPKWILARTLMNFNRQGQTMGCTTSSPFSLVLWGVFLRCFHMFVLCCGNSWASVAYQWLLGLSKDITTEKIARIISRKLQTTVVRNLTQKSRSAFYCVLRAVKVLGPRVLLYVLSGRSLRTTLDFVLMPLFGWMAHLVAHIYSSTYTVWTADA
jgi:hypothetical protein